MTCFRKVILFSCYTRWSNSEFVGDQGNIFNHSFTYQQFRQSKLHSCSRWLIRSKSLTFLCALCNHLPFYLNVQDTFCVGFFLGTLLSRPNTAEYRHCSLVLVWCGTTILHMSDHCTESQTQTIITMLLPETPEDKLTSMTCQSVTSHVKIQLSKDFHFF